MQTMYTYTKFDTADVRGSHSAGILPFLRREGKVAWLLGKEEYHRTWKGSHRWSAFEGGRHVGETLEQVALREFREETLGCFPEVEDAFTRGKYTIRITHSITKETPARRFHTTYIVETRVRDEVDAFAFLRKDLLLFRQLGRQIASLLRTLPGWAKDGLRRGAGGTTLHAWQAGGEVWRRVHLDPSLLVDRRTAAFLDLLASLRATLEGVHVPPEMGCVVRNANKEAVDTLVRGEYLEKERVAVLVDKAVENMIENSDSWHGKSQEQMRPFFVPVIQCAMRNLRCGAEGGKGGGR